MRATFRFGDDAHGVATRLVAALDAASVRGRAAQVARRLHDATALGERFLSAVRDDVARLRDCVFVLDGLDMPADGGLTDELDELSHLLRDTAQVVVGRRSRPGPFTRRFGHDDVLLHLDDRELAFTDEEAFILVRELAGRELSEQQVEGLLTRTDGWAVGVQLAAIGLRGAPDVDAYIDEFTGADRYVSAYFNDEVLAHETPETRRFLLETSVLESLHAPLCDAITRRENSAEILHDLERRGVFTRRRTAPGDEFEYHALFRDVLRHELRLAEPGAEGDLLATAGRWHAARKEPNAAARYLIEAEEWRRLIDLVDSFAQPMIEQGRAADALRWLDAIPDTRDADDGRVDLRRAFLHTMLGESAQAGQIVHDLESKGLSHGEKVAIDVLRATWAFFDASPKASIRAADAALGALPDTDPSELPNVFGMTSPIDMTVMAAGSRARARWYMGEIVDSRRELTALAKQGGVYAPWLVHVVSSLALLECWAGNLRTARMNMFQAMNVAASARLLDHVAVVDARLAGAHVFRERDDLPRAAAFLADVRKIAGDTRRPITHSLCALEQAAWCLAAGQLEEGLATIEHHRAVDESPRPPAIETRLRAVEVRLVLALGDNELAQVLVDGAPPSCECSELHAAAMQTAIARRDLTAARDRLVEWTVDEAVPRDWLLRELWTAVLALETGNHRQALVRAAALVNAAEIEGHVRLFLDGGRPVIRLLRALHNTAPMPYATLLLQHAESTTVVDAGTPLGLSKRELEVIRYLPTHLSNAQIASRLYVSVNTLKTHLRTIYRKLGVTSRRDAIRRAEQLGIA
jgi:LuxR family maltose regulon positive regulatory protein